MPATTVRCSLPSETVSFSSFLDFGTGSAARTSATRSSTLPKSAMLSVPAAAAGAAAAGSATVGFRSSTRGKRPESFCTGGSRSRRPTVASASRGGAVMPSAARILPAAPGTNGSSTIPR